jgi:hypothetical protein
VRAVEKRAAGATASQASGFGGHAAVAGRIAVMRIAGAPDAIGDARCLGAPDVWRLAAPREPAPNPRAGRTPTKARRLGWGGADCGAVELRRARLRRGKQDRRVSRAAGAAGSSVR